METINIQHIQFRRTQLATQLQDIAIQIARAAQQLEQLKVQEIATKGAIAGLDEIITSPTTYGQPTSVVDKRPQPEVNGV